MKKIISISFLFCYLHSNAQVTEKIHTPSLDFMMGNWKGSGWMMTEKGKTNATITEKVQCKLDCSIYLSEGLGKRFDSASNADIVVHDAFGIIVYDKVKGKWVIRAYKKEGASESELEFLGDKKFRWVLIIPGRGTVRYTTDFSSGRWVEMGEFSRDEGATWMPIMSMSLDKE